SRVNPLLQGPAANHRRVSTPDRCVGAGLPANTVAAATVKGGWRLASRAGPFAATG
ncbi:diguanylate phosphodiesterase, partial [Pseudomonas putida]